MWKFFQKAQFPHSLGRTVYFTQWNMFRVHMKTMRENCSKLVSENKRSLHNAEDPANIYDGGWLQKKVTSEIR